MKIYTAMLCVALTAVFALSACGSGNNSTGSNSSSESAAPKTPAEERQAVANKMRDAFVAFDGDAVKALFLPEEHENVEKRIVREMTGMKADGFKVTGGTPTIEEKDGKFFASFPNTIESKDGTKEEDTNTLRLLEKDGKWYLSFTK